MWCGSHSTGAHLEPSWPPNQEATDLPAAVKEVPVAADRLAVAALAAADRLAAEALAVADRSAVVEVLVDQDRPVVHTAAAAAAAPAVEVLADTTAAAVGRERR